jgi:hypothetical protein
MSGIRRDHLALDRFTRRQHDGIFCGRGEPYQRNAKEYDLPT